MQLTYQETEKLSARCELFREELSKSNQLIPEQMLAEYVLNLVQLGDSYYLRELLEMKSINLGSNFLLCALNTAFDYERSSCAALIREQIEIKMSPDIKGNWLDQSVIKDCETIHFSLVHYAADKNDMDFLNKLYEVGAPLNTLNRYGLSALNMSIANLNEEMVRALLEKGANPNLQDRNGWTPLYIAVSMGSKNISALLLA